MAHSLEARVPFLDYRLVELGFSLPGDELIRRGRTKDVLRRALADLLPPQVRERRTSSASSRPRSAGSAASSATSRGTSSRRAPSPTAGWSIRPRPAAGSSATAAGRSTPAWSSGAR